MLAIRKNLQTILIFCLFIILSSTIIYISSSPVLNYHFAADDWPLLWGVSQQDSIFFNPGKVFYHYEDERFAIREGYFQVWWAYLLLKIYGLNPYWFHLWGFILKVIASTAIGFLGFKLTKKIYIGIIAGLLFASEFIGIESLYWFNTNITYLVIAFDCLIIYLVIKAAQGNNKALITSLFLISLNMILYSPRSQVMFALPFVIIFWVDKIFSKRTFLYLILILLTLTLPVRLFFGENGSTQAFNAISRVFAFGGPAFTEGKRMFLTYPLDVISISFIPERIIHAVANYPEEFFLFNKIAMTHFRIWNFIFFPLIWIGFIYLLKITTGQKQRIRFYIWTAIGIGWLFFNLILRTKIFTTEWDWSTHFLFILSRICILFSLASFDFLKNDKTFGNIARLLPSCIFLLLASFFFNWAFDPLIYPGYPNFQRYMTISAVFGNLFIALIFGWLITLIWINFKKGSLPKKILLFLTGILIFYFVFLFIDTNIKMSQYAFNGIVTQTRSVNYVDSVYKKILADVNFGNPPPIIIIDSWEYTENFGMFMSSGHSLALLKGITNPDLFPIMVFGKESLYQRLPDICRLSPGSEKNVYYFKLEKNQTINISDKLPPLSCEKNNIN